MSYSIFAIDPAMEIEELVIPVEGTGYLRKFWVEHPQLGQSLIKIEEDTAPAWSEKVSYEIAARLKLPAASYEFGELVDWSNYADRTKVIVSPNFKSGEIRIFTQIPSERIDSKALVFSRELLNYNRSQLLGLESELSSTQSLNDLYLRYAQNIETPGLSQAKEIAKNALIDGIEPERIAKMLIDNNAAYQDLVSRSGTEQAQKMIVRKAQMELTTSKSKQSADGQTRPNQKSPRIR